MKAIPKCRIITTSSSTKAICQSAMSALGGRLRALVDVRNLASFESAVHEPRQDQTNVLVVSRMVDLPFLPPKRAQTATGRATKFLVIAGDSPPETMGERLPLLQVKNPQRLLVTSEGNATQLSNLVARLVRGMIEESRKAIVAANWEGENKETLVVIDSSLERMRIPRSKLEKLLGTDPEHLSQFEIDSDGSFIYWPHADVHLGCEQFASLVDPARALATQIRLDAHNQRYGRAIRAMREEAGLKQSDIHSIDARTVGRVERGEMTPSSKTLRALAAAHGLPDEKYLSELAQRVAVV